MGAIPGKRPIGRDIEGLRAVAVISVVVNHMQSSALQGGFAGVDIFFVISGYLIGMHLLEDIQEGRFRFWRFYGSRARRLLPALIVMLVAVWGGGWLILSGPEFADLGKHIAATALFANNILLWSQSGYFDAPASTKPLLHLWSLGVEEQFYLLVPILLWLSSAGGHASIRWVLRLSAVSLLVTVLYAAPSFYLLDTRFWELGVGVASGYVSLNRTPLFEGKLSLSSARYAEFIAFAVLIMLATALVYYFKRDPWDRLTALTSGGLLALSLTASIPVATAITHRDRDIWKRLCAGWRRHETIYRSVASFAGLCLITASLVTLSSMDWPGPQTSFPVLGTTLIILAGPTSPVNRLLAWRPFVFVGGISYPLYLWHWPAIVYWKMLDFDRSAMGQIVPVIGASLLACLTRELIEYPFRFGMLGSMRLPIPRLRMAIVGLLVSGLVGASTAATGGYPARIPDNLREVANWSPPSGEIDSWITNVCLFRPGFTDEFDAQCTPAKRPGAQQILLFGDSHAAHLYPGLSHLHGRYDFVLVQWTANGCPPVLTPFTGEADYCAQRRSRAIRDMGRVAPDSVLVSGAWEKYLAQGNSEATILAAIQRELRWLRDSGVRHIVLFGPERSWVTSESADLFRYMLRKRLEYIPERIGRVSTAVHRLDAAMAAQAAGENVEYVSVIDRFCDPKGCLVLGDPQIVPPDFLFRDQDHLTPTGSRLLIEAAAPKIFAPPSTRLESRSE